MCESNQLSTDKILLATVDLVSKLQPKLPAKHLDIGSGTGELIKLLREKMEIESTACDYTSALMKLDIKVDVVNLNTEKLPYADNSFDIVTMTEVVEHLEHYRETLQEAYRVLRKDGILVVSTPNILNLKSRIRFLFFGFYNLFGPLHFKESNLHTTGGHITPISLFYLVHSFVDAGFSEIQIRIDKRQKSSLLWLVFLYFPIKFFSALLMRKEKDTYKTIDEHNESFVKKINSLDILLGRTIIVGGRK